MLVVPISKLSLWREKIMTIILHGFSCCTYLGCGVVERGVGAAAAGDQRLLGTRHGEGGG